MEEFKYKLILGSQSPRRKELLKASFLKYEIVIADLDEISELENPEEIVVDLALQKARAVYKSVDDERSFVIGADTIVVYENEILGKPKDIAEARETLNKLSGHEHQVLTGVSFVYKNNEYSFYETTQVKFQKITPDLLELYLETGDSLDKAGAYGIQASALSFIDSINGSYSNVVGFPIDKVILHLKKELGFESDIDGKWRNCFE
ncbi:MAG: septum formation protein [Bacteriovoracaceae bacterium]|jgi:septum formation protein